MHCLKNRNFVRTNSADRSNSLKSFQYILVNNNGTSISVMKYAPI